MPSVPTGTTIEYSVLTVLLRKCQVCGSATRFCGSTAEIPGPVVTLVLGGITAKIPGLR